MLAVTCARFEISHLTSLNLVFKVMMLRTTVRDSGIQLREFSCQNRRVFRNQVIICPSNTYLFHSVKQCANNIG